MIGINGKKQSGKSTLAEYLRKEINKHTDKEAIIFSFADALKEMCYEYFFMPVWGEILPHRFDQESFKKRKHPCGKTVREILQIVGTACRDVWPDIWIENLCNPISWFEKDTIIIVPDVRFPNEADYIRKEGGKLIRLTRSPFRDKHISETALDNYEHFDAIIANQRVIMDKKNKVAKQLLTHWGILE